MKLLWLASWYPDAYEPTNGDFVQRHAQAVSRLIPIDVIHVAQAGKDFNHINKTIERNNGNLRESIHYFPFKKTGIHRLDKVRYNRTYIRYYKKILLQYMQQKGKPDIVHVHVPMKAGILALWLKKKYGIPYIVSEHSSLYLPAATDSFATRSYFFRHYTRKIFQQAAQVTNVSAAIAAVLKQMFGLNEVRIIPNVVDTNFFNCKLKTPNKVFRWLHVSTMLPLKNVDKIIHAFKAIAETRNDWELVLVGPINKEYQKLVQQCGLQQKISFTGEIAYEAVAREMQQADAFIMFSQHENFPCVIIEALCCGLPVVASNVGGTAEAVNATNGILVQANNTEQLQEAIVNVMDNIKQFDPETIAGAAISTYSYETVAKQFVEMYSMIWHTIK